MVENRVCTITECQKGPHAHGWCQTHYRRWQRHGDPCWVPTKKCSRCELEKETKCFRKFKSKGYNTFCTDCEYNYGSIVCMPCGNTFKKSRINQLYCSPNCKNKAIYKRRISFGLRPEVIRLYRITDSVKLTAGCKYCGYNIHPAALDFDHPVGVEKRFNIGQGANRNIVILWEEINKCDVVCANCHRVLTRERRANNKKNV